MSTLTILPSLFLDSAVLYMYSVSLLEMFIYTNMSTLTILPSLFLDSAVLYIYSVSLLKIPCLSYVCFLPYHQTEAHDIAGKYHPMYMLL